MNFVIYVAYYDDPHGYNVAMHSGGVGDGISGLLFYLGLGLFLIRRVVPTMGRSLSELGFLRIGRREWAAIALGVIATLFLTMIFNGLLESSDFADHQQAGFEDLDLRDVFGRALFFLDSVLFGPFAEELLFRVVLLGALAEIMPWSAAAAFSSLVFGAAHGDVVFFPILALSGLVNAIAYKVTGNIFTSVAIHGIGNLLSGLESLP